MNAEKCLFCGADIPEGRQICPQCEQIYTPDADIWQAFNDGTPVECDGVKYGCISALIVRRRVSYRCALKVPYIVQVELMSARTQSVTIAAPKDVKVLKEYKK